VVTNYNPPGNYTGQFNENVPRKLSSSEVQPNGEDAETSDDSASDGEMESYTEDSTNEE
jgi:hypothetical protein